MKERDPVVAAGTGETLAAGGMAAAAQGDVTAFLDLCAGYIPMLMGMALRMSGDRQDAEKSVYDVLIEAWRSCRIYDPARFSVRVWWTIGVRTMALRRSRGRRTKRMAATHDTMIAQIRATDEATDVPPLRDKVRRILDALTNEQRSLLQLAYFDNLSPLEIGDRSHMNAGQVRMHIAEALRCLRTSLYWIDQPEVGPVDEFAAGYLLGEVSASERAACDLGDPVRGLDAKTTATTRDSVHALALYTMPGPTPAWLRQNMLAAITGPDRIQPFGIDLARFLSTDLDTAREYIARIDRPHGWLEDTAGVRLLTPEIRGNQRRPPSDEALATTMIQAPAWPDVCLVRIAPGQHLGPRYRFAADVLVLQGELHGNGGTAGVSRIGPGSHFSWRPGAPLGTAGTGEIEVICAVRARGPAP